MFSGVCYSIRIQLHVSREEAKLGHPLYKPHNEQNAIMLCEFNSSACD